MSWEKTVCPAFIPHGQQSALVAATPWITSVLLRSFQIGKVELYAIAFNMCWL
jgi:hypothetical protein